MFMYTHPFSGAYRFYPDPLSVPVFIRLLHPTASIASVTEADLIPYMPVTGTVLPKIESLDGTMLSINYNVMPPVAGTGTAYDPSGDPKDGLWDVGAP